MRPSSAPIIKNKKKKEKERNLGNLNYYLNNENFEKGKKEKKEEKKKEEREERREEGRDRKEISLKNLYFQSNFDRKSSISFLQSKNQRSFSANNRKVFSFLLSFSSTCSYSFLF